MSEALSAPSEVSDLAESCVQFVQKSMGVALDYTPDTLPILDHYLEQLGDISDETTLLIASCVGAYFGELVCRKTGIARWHFDGQEPQTCRIEFIRCFLFFNPMGAALEAMLKEDVDEWSSHFQLLDKDRPLVLDALDQSEGVSEFEYYRLTTRWEALQTVLHTLITGQSKAGEKATFFSKEVYDVFVSDRRSDLPSV